MKIAAFCPHCKREWDHALSREIDSLKADARTHAEAMQISARDKVMLWQALTGLVDAFDRSMYGDLHNKRCAKMRSDGAACDCGADNAIDLARRALADVEAKG